MFDSKKKNGNKFGIKEFLQKHVKGLGGVWFFFCLMLNITFVNTIKNFAICFFF